MLNKDIGVYVVHALQGYEFHERRIINLLEKYSVDFEFVTDGDVSYFSPELLNRYFIPNILDKYGKGAISCTLNHMKAYEKFLETKMSYALIFENDPCFLGDFMFKMNNLQDEIASLGDGFILSLENTTLTYPSFFQVKKGKHIYQARQGRMAGAYLVDRVGAESVLNDLQENKCADIIDWWHNRMVDRGLVQMYWVHPPLVEQGSHNGLMSASISTKEKSFIRRMKWLSQKLYKMYFVRLFKQKRLLAE